jgi:hypothetical protein
MNSVEPRVFRIVQVSAERWEAQEREFTPEKKRRFLFWTRTVQSSEKWLAIDSSGDIYKYDHYEVWTYKQAQEAIDLRKENLLRQDEFPKICSEQLWDGYTYPESRIKSRMVSA